MPESKRYGIYLHGDTSLLGLVLSLDDQGRVFAEAGRGFEELKKTVLDYACIVDSGRRCITSEEDPEAWLQALPSNFSGTYCRAVELPPMRCDFCSSPEVLWRYMAFDFIAFGDETMGGGESLGDWAACDPCHALIDAGDRAALARRTLDTLMLAHPEMILDTAEILKQITDLHAKFFSQRFAEPSRIAA